MKKLLLITTILLCSITVFAQLDYTIATDDRQTFVYDENTDKLVKFTEYQRVVTFFELTNNFTYLKHTTPTQTTSYNLQLDSMNLGATYHSYFAMSDTGENYYIVFDYNKQNVRFVYHWEDDVMMSVFRIKNYWLNEE